MKNGNLKFQILGDCWKVRMKILVVDDDNNKVVEISNVIKEVGVDDNSMEVVTTAACAMKRLKSECFDLLIVDLLLPKRLGEAPVSDGGVTLIQSIHRSSEINTPEFIVGLTADEEAYKSSQEDFAKLLWTIELTGYDKTEWRLRLQQKILHLRQRELQRQTGSQESAECDVLFVCALSDPELEQLHIASGSEWSQVFYPGDSALYWKSTVSISGKTFQAHSTCLPQMGLVAAATSVSNALRTLKPKFVVMCGICAGRKDDCQLGDTIAASITWDYGSGKFVLDEAEEVVFEPAPVHVPVDPLLLSAVKGLSSENEKLEEIYHSCRGFRPSYVPKLRVGPMASGAAVQNYPDFFTSVADQNRKILGVDMEAFGVAWACYQCIDPSAKWLVVKGVSDFADGKKNNDFQKFSSFMSAKIAINVISNFI